MKNIYTSRNKIRRFKRDISTWSVWVLILVLLIGLPIYTIGIRLFDGPGEMWEHIVEHLLGLYLANSLSLILGCGLLTLIFGVFSAWFVSHYDFPGRRQLEWLLILPLAIPSYITAYAYHGLFEFSGSLPVLFRHAGIPFNGIDFMNLPGLILVLSISLYPYVYVSTRVAFLHQSNRLKEVSALMGTSLRQFFFRVALPLARPAIVGGLMLVMMEVLNDYGAAHYYGVNTFTTGIFRAWFSLQDPQTAIYLSALLVAIIFGLLFFESWQRRNKRYTLSAQFTIRNLRTPLKGKAGIIAMILTFIPFLLGFMLPLAQLIYWAILTWSKVVDTEFIQMLWNSFGIALSSAVITALAALLLIYMSDWNRLYGIRLFARSATLGYAIPGAIIAIGILIPTLAMDKFLIGFLQQYFNVTTGFIINGTIAAMVYAYLVRFLTVAYNPLEAASLKIGKHLSESSRLLGRNRLRTLLSIEMPLLKTGLFSAIVLVFVDVLKELPLTLILKPYHIQTLAVKAYEYASDEMVAEASMPSLCIIVTCAIIIRYLNKIISN
ncbi:MAG: ABC transporter permease subunit [Bacteroidetes bacterium]|jgi:iron(III) transport system permease protein|nr:ABC transporter permease subunit [Bacteroidota bacterium]